MLHVSTKIIILTFQNESALKSHTCLAYGDNDYHNVGTYIIQIRIRELNKNIIITCDMLCVNKYTNYNIITVVGIFIC